MSDSFSERGALLSRGGTMIQDIDRFLFDMETFNTLNSDYLIGEGNMAEEYGTCPECGSDWTAYDSSDGTLYCANCNRYYKMRQQNHDDLTFAWHIVEPLIGPPLKRFFDLFNPAKWLNTVRRASEEKRRKKHTENEDTNEEKRFVDEDGILSSRLPKDVLDLLYSNDVRQELAKICVDNRIVDETKIGSIGYATGEVLLGNLRIEQFQEVLEEKAQLPSHLASKVAREIDESVFSQVRASLVSLHSKD